MMKKENPILLFILSLLLGSSSLYAQEHQEGLGSVSDSFFYRAMQFQGYDQVPQAINHLWMAYQIDSTQPAVLMRLSRLLVLQGNMDRASEMMESAYRHSGYDYHYGMELLQVAGRFNDWALAERTSTRLLGERPEDKSLRYFLFNLYRESGQSEEALRVIRYNEGDKRDAEMVAKEAALLYDLGRKEEMKQLLQPYVEAYPGDYLYALPLAQVYWEEDPTKAEALMETMLQHNPNSHVVTNYAVASYSANKQYDKVKEEILRVAELEGADPNYIIQLLELSKKNTKDLARLLPFLIEVAQEVYQLYGDDRFALQAAGDYMLLSDTLHAEQIFEKLMADGTQATMPYYYFVEKYAQSEEVEKLDSVVTKGLEALPDDGLLNLYAALVAINGGDTVAFASKVKQGIEVVSPEDPFYAQLALLQADLSMEQKGDWAETVKYYEIAISKGIPTAYNNYAYALTKHGTAEDLNKAEEMASKAIKADSENPAFLDTYAWVLYLKKGYPLARIYMERAINKAEDPEPLYYEHYADILTALGEYDEALQALRKALEAGAEVKVIEKKILEVTKLQKQAGGDEK